MKTKTHTYRISVDGRKRIEWKERPKISQARVIVAGAKSSTCVTTSNFIPFCGQSRRQENVSVDTNRSIRFRRQRKRIGVDRAATGTSTYSFRKMSRDSRKLANNTFGESFFLQCQWLQYAIFTTTIFFVYLSELIGHLVSKTAQNVKYSPAKSKDTFKILLSKT